MVDILVNKDGDSAKKADQLQAMHSDLSTFTGLMQYYPDAFKNVKFKHPESGKFIKYPIFELNIGEQKCRFAIPNLKKLQSSESLVAIGFFGTEKAFVKPNVRTLVEKGDVNMLCLLEPHNGTGVCAYVSYIDGVNSANLILIHQEEGKDKVSEWKTIKAHTDLAFYVAPDNYDNVAIGHGVLSQGRLKMNSFKSIIYQTQNPA